MLKTLAIVALLASPALAQKKKNKGEDAAPPPEAPAESAPKKNKNKDRKDEAPAAPPAAEAPKGNLKPGQGVGPRICLGSTSGIGNIDVSSKETVGVATCNGALKRVFLEKGICKGKAKLTKVEYGWQFADTTGKDHVSCP